MIAKAQKKETIVQERKRGHGREKMKRGISSLPPSKNFKKPKDRSFSAPRRDCQPMSFY